MRLADYLAQKHMSAAEFAAIIDVDRSTVSRWLDVSQNKTFRPRWDQIPRITAATDGLVTANDFVGAAEDEHENGEAA